MFDDKEMLERVPRCLYIIGGIIAGLQLIGCIFVRPRPNEVSSRLSDFFSRIWIFTIFLLILELLLAQLEVSFILIHIRERQLWPLSAFNLRR